MTDPTNTFADWLRGHVRDASALGDLSRAVRRDQAAPKWSSKLVDWQQHLQVMNAPNAAMQTLAFAFILFDRWLKQSGGAA